jgi:hypothetical protein
MVLLDRSPPSLAFRLLLLLEGGSRMLAIANDHFATLSELFLTGLAVAHQYPSSELPERL